MYYLKEEATYKYSEYQFHLWSKHFIIDERPIVNIVTIVLLTSLELIRSCLTTRSYSMLARPRRGVSCSRFFRSLLMWMFNINTTNTVASECKKTVTLLDPLHKLEYNESHWTTCEKLSSKLETIITSAKARSMLWVATEFGGWLKASPTLFVSLPSCVAYAKKVETNNFTFHLNN
jgi:hypothetical protein